MKQNRRITENDVKKAVKDVLNSLGIFHFPILKGLGAKKGISDRLAVWKERGGRMIAIEVKAPGKHPTPEQIQFLEDVRRQGGIAFVAHSVDEVIDGLGVRDRFLV